MNESVFPEDLQAETARTIRDDIEVLIGYAPKQFDFRVDYEPYIDAYSIMCTVVFKDGTEPLTARYGVSAQFVEHLDFDYLNRFRDEMVREIVKRAPA